MVVFFRPFIEHLIELNLSRKTIRKHIDNLWILGGEIIRDLNETPPLEKCQSKISSLIF
jgi:biotin operon repressor